MPRASDLGEQAIVTAVEYLKDKQQETHSIDSMIKPQQLQKTHLKETAVQQAVLLRAALQQLMKEIDKATRWKKQATKWKKKAEAAKVNPLRPQARSMGRG